MKEVQVQMYLLAADACGRWYRCRNRGGTATVRIAIFTCHRALAREPNVMHYVMHYVKHLGGGQTPPKESHSLTPNIRKFHPLGYHTKWLDPPY